MSDGRLWELACLHGNSPVCAGLIQAVLTSHTSVFTVDDIYLSIGMQRKGRTLVFISKNIPGPAGGTHL